MERTVNLEEILKEYLTVETMRANNPDYTFNMVLSAMREGCCQVLKLAAENAECDKEIQPITGVLKPIPKIDKESITNTINQVV